MYYFNDPSIQSKSTSNKPTAEFWMRGSKSTLRLLREFLYVYFGPESQVTQLFLAFNSSTALLRGENSSGAVSVVRGGIIKNTG